jgi:hypothetical protein
MLCNHIGMHVVNSVLIWMHFIKYQTRRPLAVRRKSYRPELIRQGFLQPELQQDGRDSLGVGRPALGELPEQGARGPRDGHARGHVQPALLGLLLDAAAVTVTATATLSAVTAAAAATAAAAPHQQLHGQSQYPFRARHMHSLELLDVRLVDGQAVLPRHRYYYRTGEERRGCVRLAIGSR